MIATVGLPHASVAVDGCFAACPATSLAVGVGVEFVGLWRPKLLGVCGPTLEGSGPCAALVLEASTEYPAARGGLLF